MKGHQDRIWVTTALTNEDVVDALTLCLSIKQNLSIHKLAVLVSSGIDSKLRQALHFGFDFVFQLESDKCTIGLSENDYAKVHLLLALQAFDNCVYLSPSMLTLNNCDELFAEFTKGFVFPKKTMGLPIFQFKPSLGTYQLVMEWLGSQGKNDLLTFESSFSNWARRVFDESKVIPEKFCVSFSEKGEFHEFNGDIAIANMKGVKTLPTCGIVNELVYNHWINTQKIAVSLIDKLSSSPEAALSLRSEAGMQIESHRDHIAIVGVSCRYPGSNNVDEFWELLREAKDATSKPPSFRWMREQCSHNLPDARNINAGFLKVPVDEFDAKFFGISPKEAFLMDPQHRLLHELVWEALENACINPHTLRGTSGSVYVGPWLNDYKEILVKSGNHEFFRTYMGNSIGAAAARLSFLLGMTGPSIATESGCSSAIVAVHLACRALQNGETNLSLVCGVNLLLHQFATDIMSTALSPDGHCKTFSEDANGFARAEGGGVLVLKRFSEAVKNGDNILGIIRGSAMCQEGISKSMGTPTVYCESLAMKEALKDADVSPENVFYVEAHGTGTAVGDPLEISAITEAYSSSNRQRPLIIGSVKTNVGHTESCSGITGIMKVLLAFQHQLIPAHRNFTRLNPAIDLNAIPAEIPLEPVEWPRTQGKRRIAGVSSFGITGTDAHIILEEAPHQPFSKPLVINSKMDRDHYILKLSTKTEEAMDQLLRRFTDYLKTSSEHISDIAYSANTGRPDFPIRTAIIGKSKEELCRSIETGKFTKGVTKSEKRDKICFLFTGQGSQSPGLADDLYKTCPVFRMHFEHCEQILRDNYNINLRDILGSAENKSGDETYETVFCQLVSIFCIQYGLLKLWESLGIKPDFVLGHSLGEFAAAVCAGIISVEDALGLIVKRSRLIEKLPRGKMLAVRADVATTENEFKKFAGPDIDKILEIAAVNSSEQTVVAGDSDAVEKFSAFCGERKIKNMILGSTHAYHSRHMDPILEEYGAFGETIKYQRNHKCGFISGFKAEVMNGNEIDSEYWVQNTRQKVNFLRASQKAVQLGCKIFIEIGPHPILSALTMMNNDCALICLPSIRQKEDEWNTLLSSLAKLYIDGAVINWNGLDQLFLRKKVSLPNYPFIGKKFWPQIVESTGNAIHPLIGAVIPNASPIRLYQCNMSLKTNEYIRDHAIGHNLILPAAGFLEMCLAAGFATVDNSIEFMAPPTRPMKVENLVIKTPLLINESACQLQTVAQFNTTADNDWNDVSIRILHKVDIAFESKWVEHATATFSPVPTAEEQTAPLLKSQFFDILKRPCDEYGDEKSYNAISTVGLNLGPAFRTLEQVWMSDDDSTLLAKIKTQPRDENQLIPYIFHPVLLDAMLQAIFKLRFGNKLKRKLVLPVRVNRFVYLTKGLSESSDVYVYVQKNIENGSYTGFLLDSNAAVLCIMSNPEFIETNVRTVESVLNQQITTLPQMWDEVWRPQIGPMQDRFDLSLIRENLYTDEFYKRMVSTYNNIDEDLEGIFKELDKLIYYNILRSMYICGFKPSLDMEYDENELMESLGIQKNLQKLFQYFLRVLENEGTLTPNKPAGTWTLKKIPPTLDQIESDLSSVKIEVDLLNVFKPALLIIRVGKNLWKILRGTESGIRYLFPENESVSLADFYTQYVNFFGILTMTREIAEASFSHLKNLKYEEGNILRVCEIGAGSGIVANILMEIFVDLNIKFEYTFTDISPAFFDSAAKKLERYSKHVIFKKLNIEEDPISQGFTPLYFDYIVASDVIHATRNIKETLENIKIILKPEARFEMFEQTRDNRILNFLFGLSEGFWKFEDFDHCTLETDKWVEILEHLEFEILRVFPSVSNHHSFISCRSIGEEKVLVKKSVKNFNVKFPNIWVIFHQNDDATSNFLLKSLSQLANRAVVIVRPGLKYRFNLLSENVLEFTINIESDQDYIEMMNYINNLQDTLLEGIVYAWSLNSEYKTQDKILQPIFYLAKSVFKIVKTTELRLITLTRGTAPTSGNGLFNIYTSTISGFMKSMRSEREDIFTRCIDIGFNETKETMLQIFYELWSTGNEMQVAYRDFTRYIPKVTPLKPALAALKLPRGSEKFHIVLPDTKSISDLKFEPLETPQLKPNEIEVQVKATGLNFRDVFSVLKPSEYFKDVNVIGADFSGVVKRVHPNVTKWRVGDNVFGINFIGACLPSHVNVHEDEVASLPDDMTFAEACTLPVSALTSYLSLIEIANIKPTDTVLIHTASGGVGLGAVQICKYVRAEIIATAGNQRKQNFLRSLGIQHVFNSRRTHYGDQILELTDGRGVDVVLNSLTSAGFKEASVKALVKGGRFIELSKLSIWSSEEVYQLRPDVSYTVVDLSTVEDTHIRHLVAKCSELVNLKAINPLPYVRFDGVHIREALQFLQNAKHIGKIVCVMPEFRCVNGEIDVFTPMFNSRSTYLITGGLGGIGFEVCKWMIANGAKYVVLAGRNGPNPTMIETINRLNAKYSSNIQTITLDVADFKQCKEFMDSTISKMGFPILRGVMHAAGTLQDGFVENQSWESLSSTFNAKVEGTLNLHKLTQTNMKLEHFVLFSSISAIFGSPAQSNHSAGNQFEDTIAHYRHSVGLPATTINWGQWGEVGIAKEIEIPGIKPFSVCQAISGLEYALKSQRTQTAILNVESFLLISKYCPHISSILDERVWSAAKNSLPSNVSNLNSEEFWKEYDTKTTLESKQDIIKSSVRQILRNILKLEESDNIGDNDDFQDMGMDSLMFVEINNSLQTLFRDRITVSSSMLRDCHDIEEVSKTLVQEIEGIEKYESTTSMEDVNKLISEDCQLPLHIMPHPNQQKLELRNISTVLITGVTGTLGPYILRELSGLKQITRIICVVRAKPNENITQRLSNILKERDIISEINMSIVDCVKGNVALEKIGLDEEIWDRLVDSVDAVFHCAASVNHTKMYSRSNSQSSIRSVNIGGLKNILEFCCSGEKLKHIFYASSVLAVATLDKDGCLSESWPESNDFDGVTQFAYPITKFVGDVIMKEAISKRGIPGKVFRFPYISGDSKSGRFLLQNNHVMLRYLFIMKTGVTSSNPFPLPCLPVDLCAEVSVSTFFNQLAPNEIYNISNIKPDTDQEFVKVAKKFGRDIKIVEFSEFAEKVQTSDDKFMAVFKEIYLREDDLMLAYESAPALQQWLVSGSSNEDFFLSKKIKRLNPQFYVSGGGNGATMEFIYQNFIFAKEHGWLAKIGLF